MRASYRRHRLWRSLTRTRYLLAAVVVVAVVAVSLDHHRHRDRDCTWFYSANRGEIGECVPRGQLPPPGWHRFGSFRTPVPATRLR